MTLLTSARLGWTEIGRPSGRERLTGAENWPVPSSDLGATDTRKWSDMSAGLSLRNTSETPASTVVLRLDRLFLSKT